MSCAVNVSGAWKYAKQAYVNVGGSWKPCQNIYVNVSGAWKPLYTYSYATGNWGACSANCGGGTQTRTVTCQRRDATNSNLDVQTVADSFCADEAHHESVLQYPIMHRVQGNRFIWGELRW